MSEVRHAIFLSYSTQDAEAVRRIAGALRTAGLEVWFDQNELRGGDAWDASIRRQIRDCALFMPVISASTEARGEGYFRLEWRLAVERSYLMSDDQAFLMPVVVDDTQELNARVPARFCERQWTRLPGGVCTPAFVEQVRRMLAGSNLVLPAPATLARAVSKPPDRRRRWWLTGAVGVVAAIVAIAWGVAARRDHLTTAPSAKAVPGPSAAVTATVKSIAVLPFENLTGRAEDAYLADGLQEEVLNALARMRDLHVISRTSASEFRGAALNLREVGERLGVGSVLEGSVRREGRKLRLTVQLIDAASDRHLLATDYDRDIDHILGLQSEVALKVADALAATLSGYERGELERVATNNGDAYTLYLRAVAKWRMPTPTDDLGVVEPRRSLEQAVRLDPDYSDAVALLSQACTWHYFEYRDDADSSCARSNFERALALDPQLPEARLARGLYEMYVMADLDRALSDLDAVVQVRPNSADAQSVLGLVLRRLGRFDEALVHFKRAWDLDPLDHRYDLGVLTTLLGLRRFPELHEQIELHLRRFPTIGYAYIMRAYVECQMQHSHEPLVLAYRDHGSALTAEERPQAESDVARVEGRYQDAARLRLASRFASSFDNVQAAGYLYWAAGMREESAQMFRASEREAQSRLAQVPSDDDAREKLALAQSMLGEHAAALATIDAVRATLPESHDRINGPQISFMRSIILVRAGRTAEGYAEVNKLLRVPFGAPALLWDNGDAEMVLTVKDDPHFNEIVNNPPRL